jgi:hypothetical protein
MTHNDLCDIAVRWLKRPYSQRGPGCACAFKEVASVSGRERADAWGYAYNYGGGSNLVEVKMTRGDFLSDRKKPHRQQPEKGMGEFRYYMCPEGVITINDLPDRWGLLVVNKRGHVKPMAGAITVPMVMGYAGGHIMQQWRFEDYNHRREANMMAYLLHRVGSPEELIERERLAYRMQNQISTSLKREQEERRELQRERSKMMRRLRKYEEMFGKLPEDAEQPLVPIMRTLLDDCS